MAEPSPYRPAGKIVHLPHFLLWSSARPTAMPIGCPTWRRSWFKCRSTVATFTPCALAAKQTTTTIPIVVAAVADQVGSGLMQSLARPGGNITGFSNMAAETAGKSVELLRDMLPSLRRVAVLANPVDPFTRPFLEHVHLAGRIASIEIGPGAMARAPAEVDAAFATMAQERGGAAA
jgi:putative ABC transport system substrate-binding protein